MPAPPLSSCHNMARHEWRAVPGLVMSHFIFYNSERIKKMKQVLIVLESPLFREYIRPKLEENGVKVSVAVSPFDGISKMRNLVPDLIILDYLENRDDFMELLKQKKQDPNCSKTPIIVFAQEIEHGQLLELVPYNVKKVFNKPIKIDALFSTLSEILGIPFRIDRSPGIMEVHVNESIIFIEIAQGLNRDKLDILRFKISELIDLYKIRTPKVIILLSDINLGFADAPNLQKLLDTVFKASKAKVNYIKILTQDDFIRHFMRSQPEYAGIEVASNLHLAIDGLVKDKGGGTVEAGERAEIIGGIILNAKTSEDEEAMLLKFDAETKKESFRHIRELLENSRIAVIDEDPVIRDMIKNTFRTTSASIYNFADGGEFLKVIDSREFDLAFLDISMSKTDGIEVLENLNARNIKYPVIALSAAGGRGTMIKAIQMGIKSYLIKPLKPEDIFMKSIEILKANF